MKTKFAIVGCGHIGKRHAKHIQNHPKAELVGVYDVLQKQSEALVAEYGGVAFSSYESLLEAEFDIVNVCTPNGSHHTLTVSALNAGIHVLVEKPMAIKKSYCEQMVKASLDNGKRLFVVKQNRFNPPVQAVKNVVDGGKLGRIFSVVVNGYWNRNEQYYKQSDWRGTLEMDGGTLFTQFSHFIDILYYLFGDVKVISGLTVNANHQGLIEFEDTGSFVFKLVESDAIGSLNYTTNAFDKNLEGSICVFAENGTIKIGGQYLNAIEYQATKGFEIEELPIVDKANDYGFYAGSMSNHDKVIDNVIQSLNGNEKIMTNAYDGLKVVEIIESFYAAAQ